MHKEEIKKDKQTLKEQVVEWWDENRGYIKTGFKWAVRGVAVGFILGMINSDKNHAEAIDHALDMAEGKITDSDLEDYLDRRMTDRDYREKLSETLDEWKAGLYESDDF